MVVSDCPRDFGSAAKLVGGWVVVWKRLQHGGPSITVLSVLRFDVIACFGSVRPGEGSAGKTASIHDRRSARGLRRYRRVVSIERASAEKPGAFILELAEDM